MIIVTGSGRSGTSAVAQVLHQSGISVGNDLLEADESNAEGYFEERMVVMMNDALLNDVGMREWFHAASREEILAAARARGDTMREIAAKATPAWKDPRFCWTLEAWMGVLPEKPRLVVCLRSASEVVGSTLKYYGLADAEAVRAVEQAWHDGYARLLEIIDAYALEAVTVEFNAMYTDPNAAMSAVARLAGRELDCGSVRRDLRHHEAPMPGHLRDMYARVLRLGAKPTPSRP